MPNPFHLARDIGIGSIQSQTDSASKKWHRQFGLQDRKESLQRQTIAGALEKP